ncbi:MAG: hypothetical protein QF416_02845 [Candidatus Marinimicrobia bacterium]|jgi:hypothetical protein|nr:hypothetical protein [Candidatus Neomarinimicrobiota bacterium]
MRDLLIGIMIVSLAVWWAVENPQTASKVVSQIQGLVTTAVNAVSD